MIFQPEYLSRVLFVGNASCTLQSKTPLLQDTQPLPKPLLKDQTWKWWFGSGFFLLITLFQRWDQSPAGAASFRDRQRGKGCWAFYFSTPNQCKTVFPRSAVLSPSEGWCSPQLVGMGPPETPDSPACHRNYFWCGKASTSCQTQKYALCQGFCQRSRAVCIPGVMWRCLQEILTEVKGKKFWISPAKQALELIASSWHGGGWVETRPDLGERIKLGGLEKTNKRDAKVLRSWEQHCSHVWDHGKEGASVAHAQGSRLRVKIHLWAAWSLFMLELRLAATH